MTACSVSIESPEVYTLTVAAKPPPLPPLAYPPTLRPRAPAYAAGAAARNGSDGSEIPLSGLIESRKSPILPIALATQVTSSINHPTTVPSTDAEHAENRATSFSSGIRSGSSLRHQLAELARMRHQHRQDFLEDREKDTPDRLRQLAERVGRFLLHALRSFA